MRKLFVLFFAVLLSPAITPAQSLPSAPHSTATDDVQWDRLTFLDPGSRVSVTSNRGTIRCTNVRVTDDGFSCEYGSIFLPALYVDLPRADVRDVRLRHDRQNFWIGVGAAAGAGFVLGVSGANPGNSQNRVANGIIGAALLGFISPPIVHAVTYWLPGRTLYRRPSVQFAPQASN